LGRHRRLREPRNHWPFICLLLGAFASLLVIHGYAVREVQPAPAARSPSAGSVVSPPLPDARPVLDPAGQWRDGASVPKRTLALTFEDGPDPRWTPRILEVLREHDARATFFMLGSQAAAHPDLVRRVAAEGHEIGSHGYSHVDIGTAPDWRQRLELTLTQNILGGITGERVDLLRPPYTSLPSALRQPQYRAAREASSEGYRVVLSTQDTRDLSGRTTEQIVHAATPRAGRGAVVLLHDAGGDRTAVVRALDRLLTRLEHRGYRFTTVSEAVGLPAADRQAGMVSQVTATTWIAANQVGEVLSTVVKHALEIVFVLTAGRLLVLMLLAWMHAERSRRIRSDEIRARAEAARAQARALKAEARAVLSRRRGAQRRAMRAWAEATDLTRDTSFHPSVSVVVPAFNEAAGIAATVRSIVDTDYPGDLEVIVVDDGSTDGTATIAADLQLPGLSVYRQPNAGKAAALNTGIDSSRHDILVLVDGDTVFVPSTLRRLVAPFVDPTVGAVSGNTKVGNLRGVLGRWQHLEYVIGFNIDRRMFDVLKCMPTVPGAIGAFRWELLAGVGGVSEDTLAEDTDLTMSICRTGWRVVYEETAQAWTEAPSSLRQLWRQRYRWCYGTLQAMWKHRGAVVSRGPAGALGRRGLAYLFCFQILLPLVAPAVDLYALFGLAFGDHVQVAQTWLGFLGLQGFIAAFALRLDGERLTPLWTLPLQQFVYRQLMYLVVIQSVVTAVLGVPLRWHSIQREGTFQVEAPPRPARPATVGG
jgi:cellulose synthase/poly-beta-1,6-N-acetylglucosamine synthase-like glycosyltransferase/peptidoglycan/xylan/chitin deacetylase (PgdA/CDA1 family)